MSESGPISYEGLFKHDPSLPNAVVTPEYLVDHGWLGGSPQTVTEKLRQMYDDIGGFGCLLVLTFAQSEDNTRWANSQRLLVEKGMPHFAHVQPD